MGCVRNRPRRHHPGHRYRADHGERLRGGGDPADGRDHALGLPALPAARGAVGDDARPHRRLTHLRDGGVRGQAAAARRAHQRRDLLGVLAGLVPRRTAEHDPGVVLPEGPVRLGRHRHVHAALHADRLDDRHHRRRRHRRHLHPGLHGHPPRRRVRDRPRPPGDDPADLPCSRLGVPRRHRRLERAEGLPAGRRLELLLGRRRPRLVCHLSGVRVPPHLERDRDGGGRLLHRRVQEPGARREDRDESLRRLRRVHLHHDPGLDGRDHRPRRARRDRLRSEDRVRHLRGQAVRRQCRLVPQLGDRDHADRRARPVRPERDHGLRPRPAPDGHRRAVPAHLRPR